MIQAPKQNFKTLILIAFVGIVFFSPVGDWLKVQAIRLTAGTPEIEKTEKIPMTSFSGTYYTENGEEKHFADLKGKVILLNFWATWCPPCVAEMPSIQKLYQTYGNKMAFVLISEETPEKTKKFLQEKGFTLPVFYKGSGFPAEIFSKYLPATYIIDKEGNIVIEKVGAADWDAPELKKELDKIIN